jgi:cbb3-type cytochrome oxidase cytochrome c subunit
MKQKGRFKKVVRIILIVLLFIFIVIQFIRPGRNKHEGDNANDITRKYPVPADVQQVLSNSCYDCHSNNTRYPWYVNIQPVGWWLANHINDGKREINFSEFSSYSIRKQFNKLKECREQVVESNMPLSSYTLIHKDAILDTVKKSLVINWIDGIMNQMKATYPPDSLNRKPRR